jgi:predicted HD phosphohydrolase
VHLAGQPLALCAGQVDIIDGQRGGVQAARLGARHHLRGQRRFAAPLQAADRQYWNRCAAAQRIIQRLFGQCFGESFHLGHIRSSGHAATIAQSV